MQSFLQRFSNDVIGVLSGFDRLRSSGSKRLLNSVGGMFEFLWEKKVLSNDFQSYDCSTDSIRRSIERATAVL